jgi:hypothetical protein
LQPTPDHIATELAARMRQRNWDSLTAIARTRTLSAVVTELIDDDVIRPGAWTPDRDPR